jgi:hypothetical protein
MKGGVFECQEEKGTTEAVEIHTTGAKEKAA